MVSLATEVLPVASKRSMRWPANASLAAGGAGAETMRPLSGCSMIVPGFGFGCAVGGVCACDEAASIHAARTRIEIRFIYCEVRRTSPSLGHGPSTAEDGGAF